MNIPKSFLFKVKLTINQMSNGYNKQMNFLIHLFFKTKLFYDTGLEIICMCLYISLKINELFERVLKSVLKNEKIKKHTIFVS